MSVRREVERLRRCRELFERAQADNVKMHVARDRIDREISKARWERIRAIASCGRVALPSVEAVTTTPPVLPIDDSDEGLAWFQR